MHTCGRDHNTPLALVFTDDKHNTDRTCVRGREFSFSQPPEGLPCTWGEERHRWSCSAGGLLTPNDGLDSKFGVLQHPARIMQQVCGGYLGRRLVACRVRVVSVTAVSVSTTTSTCSSLSIVSSCPTKCRSPSVCRNKMCFTPPSMQLQPAMTPFAAACVSRPSICAKNARPFSIVASLGRLQPVTDSTRHTAPKPPRHKACRNRTGTHCASLERMHSARSSAARVT